MVFITIFTTLVLCLAGSIGAAPSSRAVGEPLPGGQPCPCLHEFNEYRQKYNRPAYPSEFFYRCNIFCDNYKAVTAHNILYANNRTTYATSIKPLHDQTEDERRAQLWFGYKKGPRDKSQDRFATWDEAVGPYANGSIKPPASQDWTWQSEVTNVRNQGQCGDCWAESATAVLEAQLARDQKVLTQLSVQQAAECSANEHNMGCGGGWPIDALHYAAKTGGLCTEVDYPTLIGDGMDRDCNATWAANCTKVFKVGTVLSGETGNVTMLAAAAQVGVVSVAIDASGQGFYSYDHGVYDGTYNNGTDCSPQALDHAVNVVGYGVSVAGNVPFFYVRNSWGVTGWGGLNGYILFKVGDTCGIAQDYVFLR